MGGLVLEHAECESPCEELAHHGFGAAHFDRPGDSGGVVTPCCELEMLDIHEGFDEQIVQQQSGHLKVIDGEGSSVKPFDNVGWPFEAPN